MPFDVIETVRAPAKVSMASISYRRRRNGKKGIASRPALVIGIPMSLVGEFKPKKGQLFAIALGKGADAGKARIAAAKEGAVAKSLKGGYVFHFGFVPMLGTYAAEKEYVNAQCGAEHVTLDLPAWFKPE